MNNNGQCKFDPSTHISEVAKSYKISALKGIFKYLEKNPGMANLTGGTYVLSIGNILKVIQLHPQAFQMQVTSPLKPLRERFYLPLPLYLDQMTQFSRG